MRLHPNMCKKSVGRVNQRLAGDVCQPSRMAMQSQPAIFEISVAEGATLFRPTKAPRFDPAWLT